MELEKSNEAIEAIEKSSVPTSSNPSSDTKRVSLDQDTKQRPKEIVKPSTSNVNEAIAQNTDEDQSKSIVEVEESNKAIEKISAPTSSSAKSAITTASNVSKDEMVTDQDIVTDEKINPDQTSNPPSDAKRIRLDEDTKQRLVDNLDLFLTFLKRNHFDGLIFLNFHLLT